MEHPNISIFQKGETTKQPIVFVHGFPYDHYMWDNVVDDLSKDYYCVTYDIRGLGGSEPEDGQYTMEMFAEDLFYVIEKTNLHKPVVCALSMGGYITLRAVEKNEEKFKALILCDTKSEADDNKGKLKRAQAINIINNKGLNTFLQEFIPTCFAEESVKRLGDVYDQVFNRSTKNSSKGVKGCLLAMAGRTDTTNYLGKIKIPTLVLCGSQDKLSPPDIMEKMASHIKKSSFVVIENSGHMTPIEQPEQVIENIRKFLTENLQTRN